MDARYYDPNLIWGMARTAAVEHIKKIGHHVATMTTHDPRIYIYADGLEGALLVIRGRLYHDADTADDHWQNTDTKIADHADKLAEVVVKISAHETVSFASYEKFVDWLKK